MSPPCGNCAATTEPLDDAGRCPTCRTLEVVRRPYSEVEAAVASNGHLAPSVPVELPMPALAEVLDELVGFVRRFVSMTESEAVAVALWTFHTHAIGAAQATPYIAVTSAEKESGKTLLLEVMNLLVAKPWLTGRATAAVLPRKIDADRPSLLLDESDTAFKGDRDYAEALRGVLNSGYRRSGKTTVCVGQGVEIGFRDFSTFCPKAIAGIGRLPDTVQSRSISIRLKRKAPGETVERFRERDVAEQARPLRDVLELLASVLVPDLAPARPELPDELGDRAQDVWEPLLAIADLAGGDWPEQARSAARMLSANGSAEDGSAGVLLLADIRTVFAERDTDRLPTEILLDALRELPESPWSEWYGKPLSARALARLLKPYAIGPHSDGTSRGYRKEAFEDAWTRYLPPHVSEVSETQSQSEKPEISIRQSESAPDTYESAANPRQDSAADTLTDTGGGRPS
jgi:Protein of unknown function (DUF3631)